MITGRNKRVHRILYIDISIIYSMQRVCVEVVTIPRRHGNFNEYRGAAAGARCVIKM